MNLHIIYFHIIYIYIHIYSWLLWWCFLTIYLPASYVFSKQGTELRQLFAVILRIGYLWLQTAQMCHCPNTQTRWFKVPFSSPSWRSLNLSKRSLNHPQKVTLNHQGHMFWPICVLKGESWSDWLVVLVVAGAWKVSKFMYQTNQTPHGFSQKICVCVFLPLWPWGITSTTVAKMVTWEQHVVSLSKPCQPSPVSNLGNLVGRVGNLADICWGFPSIGCYWSWSDSWWNRCVCESSDVLKYNWHRIHVWFILPTFTPKI